MPKQPRKRMKFYYDGMPPKFQLDEKLLDKLNLSRATEDIYTYLWKASQGGNFPIRDTNETIIAQTKVGKGTVIRALDILEKQGLILRQTSHKRGAKEQRKIYLYNPKTPYKRDETIPIATNEEAKLKQELAQIENKKARELCRRYNFII